MELTWTVNNTGSVGTLASQWYDRIVLSTDDTYGNGDDIYVGQFLHNGALASGAGYTGSHTVTMPTGVTGAYSLFVVTDIHNDVAEYPNEGNNVSAPAAVSFTGPDLVVAGVTAPANAQPGQAVGLTWTVSNIGSVGTLASQWYDRIVLSTDDTYGNADDIYVGQFLHDGAVASGAGYTGSGTVTMPTNVTGAYSLFCGDGHLQSGGRIPQRGEQRLRPAAVNFAARTWWSPE